MNIVRRTKYSETSTTLTGGGGGEKSSYQKFDP